MVRHGHVRKLWPILADGSGISENSPDQTAIFPEELDYVTRHPLLDAHQ